MSVGSLARTAWHGPRRLLAKSQTRRPEIELVRERLLNVLFVVAGIFSSVPVGVGVGRAVREGQPL